MSSNESIQSITIQTPEWAQWRKLNEQGFCADFQNYHRLAYCDGCFYGVDGALSDSQVRKLIYDLVCPFVRTDIASTVTRLLEAMKLECSVSSLPEKTALVSCRNGDYNVNQNSFSSRKNICQSRLNVAYNPQAPRPETWLAFLSELLYEEDIPTLQQYIGYCLLPVTYAQKMLLIIGNGGEGKSRIGVVLSALFGSCLVNGSLAKLEASPFARADLQNKLLMVDDDLRLEALKSTNYIKSLITAEQPMDMERKGVQSYQARVSCRFLGFGNGSLRALHDRSHGFFRRQIILTTRPVNPNRETNPFLAQEIIARELEGILLWALEGLSCLIRQDMQLSISPRSLENLSSAVQEGNNLPDFFMSTGYFRFDPCGCITSRHLYQLYRDWCTDNELPPLSSRTVSSWVIQNQQAYNLRYSSSLPAGNGRLVRGFQGLRSII